VNQGGLVGKEPGRRGPAEGDGRDHPDQGHQGGGRADPQERREVGLDADIEQEDEHADLGQESQGGIDAGLAQLFHPRHEERQVAQANPGDELAQDRGLARPLREDSSHLGGEDQHGHGKQQRAEMRMAGALGGLTNARKDERQSDAERQTPE
jgi:hypothetical protein